MSDELRKAAKKVVEEFDWGSASPNVARAIYHLRDALARPADGDVARLRAENGRLRAVLAPFAELVPPEPFEGEPETSKWIRAARATLSALSAPEAPEAP